MNFKGGVKNCVNKCGKTKRGGVENEADSLLEVISNTWSDGISLQTSAAAGEGQRKLSWQSCMQQAVHKLLHTEDKSIFTHDLLLLCQGLCRNPEVTFKVVESI